VLFIKRRSKVGQETVIRDESVDLKSI